MVELDVDCSGKIINFLMVFKFYLIILKTYIINAFCQIYCHYEENYARENLQDICCDHNCKNLFKEYFKGAKIILIFMKINQKINFLWKIYIF